MSTALDAFVLKAGSISGQLSFKSNNWTIEEANECYTDIKNNGIEGNWGWILDDNWVDSLPKRLQKKWKHLSKYEKNEFEIMAVRKAKETEQALILNLANEET